MEETNKKSNKGLIIIIILLIVVILGLIGYIYLQSKEESTKTNKNVNLIDKNITENKNVNETEKAEIKITNDDAKKLFYIFFNKYMDGSLGINIIDSDKSIITSKDLSDNEKWSIVINSLNDDDLVLVDKQGGKDGLGDYTLNAETLKNNYKKYFDEDSELPQTFSKGLLNCDLKTNAYNCYIILGGIEGSGIGWKYIETGYSIEENKLNIQGFATYYDFWDNYGYKNFKDNNYYCGGIMEENKLKECLIENNINDFNKINIEFDLSNGKTLFKKASIENKFLAE